MRTIINDVLTTVQLMVSFIVGYFLNNLGEFNEPLKLLLFLMIWDFITGTIKGMVERDINSRKLFKGGYKKCLIFLAIMIGNRIDLVYRDLFLRETIIVYYIFNEGISILENISVYIDLPPELKKFFTDMKGEEGHD